MAGYTLTIKNNSDIHLNVVLFDALYTVNKKRCGLPLGVSISVLLDVDGSALPKKISYKRLLQSIMYNPVAINFTSSRKVTLGRRDISGMLDYSYKNMRNIKKGMCILDHTRVFSINFKPGQDIKIVLTPLKTVAAGLGKDGTVNLY